MSPETLSLDLVIPVYNEESQLDACVARALEFIAAEGLAGVRLIIADNGSTDKTKDLGKALARREEKVSYLQVGKKGVGLALKTAWSRSTAECVGYMDLDLATDLKHLPEAVSSLESGLFDFVVASRRLPQSEVVGRSALRTFTSWGFNTLLRKTLQVGFSDGMCGFKFLKREAFNALSERYIFTDDWFFATEILIKAEWESMTIKEIPIRWTDDPSSKVRLLETISRYLGDIRRMKQERGSAR